MKKIHHSFNAIFCAGALMLCAGCATTQRPVDEKFCIKPDTDIVKLAEFDYSKPAPEKLEPGKIYLDPKLAEVFSVRLFGLGFNEEGDQMARVFGKTEPQTFWDYTWKGEYPYLLVFRFVWFDASGKIVNCGAKNQLKYRSAMPGDPVRFAEVKPTEECSKFSLLLCFEPKIGAEVKKEDKKVAEAKAEVKKEDKKAAEVKTVPAAGNTAKENKK